MTSSYNMMGAVSSYKNSFTHCKNSLHLVRIASHMMGAVSSYKNSFTHCKNSLHLVRIASLVIARSIFARMTSHRQYLEGSVLIRTALDMKETVSFGKNSFTHKNTLYIQE